MGMYKVDNCIFTGLPVRNLGDVDMRDAIEYFVSIEGREILIRLPHEAEKWGTDNEFFKKNKYIFEGLLLNKSWFEDTKQLINIEKLKELLSQNKIPNTPKEKANNLFQQLLKLQTEDGIIVDVEGIIESKCSMLYFKSESELLFYSKYLHEIGFIKAAFHNGSMLRFSITVEGLNHGIQLQNEGDKSDLCFIAMAFKPETANIRNAIKEALVETGFKPILIDEQNINSDRTINDEIIANLKKCRFCIADFSYHSNGVYFESGFALGQGKKVIYTCLKSEFEKAHFDIRPLQHIIYETAEQLKIDLKHKIEAWVI